MLSMASICRSASGGGAPTFHSPFLAPISAAAPGSQPGASRVVRMSHFWLIGFGLSVVPALLAFAAGWWLRDCG